MKSELAWGLLGAVVGALLFAGISSLASAKEARTNAAHVSVGSSGDEARGAEQRASGAVPSSGDPLAAANRNLVDSVRDYSAQLAKVSSEKKDLETKLAAAQRALAADGGPARNPYDLTPEDWKEMSKSGHVMFRIPCRDYNPPPEVVSQLGLSPSDLAATQSAFKAANDRAWAVIRPICIQTIGSAATVDKIGMDMCMQLTSNIIQAEDRPAADVSMKMVGQIRGGLAAPDVKDQSALTRMLLAATGTSHDAEVELARQIGPADAHRIVFGDNGCSSSSDNGPP